ncbi:MAG: Cephalosporin-C deacetylase [Fimbriimonadaceae bacterium]|nr:Cephalosporin-C deacetylase [Fimbriimonadaceae bacterium]
MHSSDPSALNPFRPYPPEDLADFWQAATAEAMAVPLEMHRSFRNEFDLPGFTVDTFSFRGVGGEVLYGWIAAPPHARGLPAFLWVPPYGRESLLPNEYGTRQGMVSLSLNFFGHDAFHQEGYRSERGYFAEGVGDPSTWVFRRMFQNAVIAVRLLQAQAEVDAERIGAMGMSQGAGMSIWLGAWCPIIRAVAADMPFLGAMSFALNRTSHRYPLKELIDYAENTPLGMEKLNYTLSYYDTINQASYCRVPTQVSLGEKDPAARPEAVEAIYNALPGEKRLIRYVWGHDWHPEMVHNNRDWLLGIR